jgi:predicted Zn-dependent protease with MMP-like domain
MIAGCALCITVAGAISDDRPYRVREIRLTVIHELGHYFSMTEAQLEDV